MAIEDYLKSTRYELLIRYAFNCPRGNKYGANLNYMQNAMTMERGENFAKHLGSFEKQFLIVKTYLSDALLKLAISKSYDTSSELFIKLNNDLLFSFTTDQLMIIVDEVFEKITELNKKEK